MRKTSNFSNNKIAGLFFIRILKPLIVWGIRIICLSETSETWAHSTWRDLFRVMRGTTTKCLHLWPLTPMTHLGMGPTKGMDRVRAPIPWPDRCHQYRWTRTRQAPTTLSTYWEKMMPLDWSCMRETRKLKSTILLWTTLWVIWKARWRPTLTRTMCSNSK